MYTSRVESTFVAKCKSVAKRKPARETEISKLIRPKRKAEGWNIRDAAGRIGIKHGTLSDLENGRTTPSFETLVGIHTAYNLPIGELARAAALDLGIQPANDEETYRQLALSLSARAQAFPDLQEILDHLAKTDPAQYRAFLVMFQTWERVDEQGDGNLA
jgi:transcriptional regulator with XRE-family HTH domain